MRRKLHKNVLLLAGQARIDSRSLIEQLCDIAQTLPAHKKLLFLLYFKYGHSTIEISQLVMKCDSTVGRRLKKVLDEVLLVRGRSFLPTVVGAAPD